MRWWAGCVLGVILLAGGLGPFAAPRRADAGQQRPLAAAADPAAVAAEVIRGFTVSDDGQIPFYATYRTFGTDVVGYPISQRFTWDGFTVQAFQKVIMQWQPGSRQVFFLNIIDVMGDRGKDGYLQAVRSTPPRLPPSFDAGLGSFDQITARRLALLDENRAIRSAYQASPAPILQYGLPTSRVIDNGSHYVMRFQRVIMQQWKERVPWAEPGQVTIANGGDIAKEVGLLPAAALGPDNGSPSRSLAVAAAAAPTATPTARPAATATPVPSAPTPSLPTVTPTPTGALPRTLAEAETLARTRGIPVWQLFVDAQKANVGRGQPPIALPDVNPASRWDEWASQARLPVQQLLLLAFFGDAPTDGPLERQAQAEVNRLRTTNGGLPAVDLHRQAVLAARAHALYDVIHRKSRGHEQIAGTTGFFGRWPPDRARYFGAKDAFLAENLHGLRGPVPVMKGFMDSPGHRANVLIQRGQGFPPVVMGYAEATMGEFNNATLTIGSCCG